LKLAQVSARALLIWFLHSAAVNQSKESCDLEHTISLQEQLLQKDIPFLRAVMPWNLGGFGEGAFELHQP